MGNQLAGAAPSQIFPVEHYLTDLPDLQFEASLGSTRFMKVARARCEAGQVTAKVFTIQDPSLNLRVHRDRLVEVKRLLEGCLNCLPFQKIYLTERAGFVVRQYVKHSLYDRLSTRPFLSPIEKRWIAFQLLLAMQQAHKHNIENIMVTSWNWVFLTDFATFKPTFLPDDNPADFSYFFDTSRKRTCYIAPERFQTRRSAAAPASEQNLSDGSDLISSLNNSGSDGGISKNNSGTQLALSSTSSNILQQHQSQFLPDGEDMGKGELLPSMDIFSAGCVLIEMFTESPPFTLSTLLVYRANEYSLEKLLEKIEDPHIRELLAHMTQRDPSLRSSANEYLSDQRGKAFPEYFYTFLQSYMQIFSSDASMMPDQKILRIKESIDSLLAMPYKNPPLFSSEGVCLLVTLVTANIRVLKFTASKIAGLEILTKMAEQVNNETILDRILPYVLVMLTDNFAQVRICAIGTLCVCLRRVNAVPPSDANIFPEYLLPAINPLCTDKSEQVRAALAENIAELARLSVRFLDLAFKSSPSESSNDPRPLPAYESELMALHESMGQMVSVLMADPANAVKQAMLEYGVTDLAKFFGKAKANDVILSHMITFLNDKDDAQLRESFYRNIVSVVTFIGWPSPQILMPLLQQGLTDSEENVIVRCVEAMSALAKPELMYKETLYQLLTDTVPYLIHPNLWIRQAAVGLVTASAHFLHPADVAVRLRLFLRPYLEGKVNDVSNYAFVMKALSEPVPRVVYDSVLRGSCGGGVDIKDLLAVLEDRRGKRLAVAVVTSTMTTPAPPSVSSSEAGDHNLRQLLRRLGSEGMSSTIEEKLLLMRENLIKLCRSVAASRERQRQELGAVIDISHLVNRGLVIRSQDFVLTNAASIVKPNSSSSSLPEHQSAVGVNEEWQHMFGGSDGGATQATPPTAKAVGNPPEIKSTPASQSGSPALGRKKEKSPSSVQQQPEQPQLGCEDTKQFDEAYSHHFATCKSDLDRLLRRKRGEYVLKLRKQEQLGPSGVNKSLPPTGWKPKGQLRAHLHEHDGAIIKIVTLPDKPVFASGSKDGCVRLWDCQKMEGSNLVNRAHRIYNSHESSGLTALAVCACSGGLMATAAEDGSLHITSLETGTVLHKRLVGRDNEGIVMETLFQETGSTPVLVYGTDFGDIVAWDLRIQNEAYRLKNGPRNGIQTALSLSEDHTWCCCGTDTGYMSCWDLRFRMPIVRCEHPVKNRIRQMIIQPGSGSMVLVSVKGHNEVGLWKMENQTRHVVLWASNDPILATSRSNQTVTAMQSVQSSVVTAGMDMRIRFWDLKNETNSFVVAGAGGEKINHKHFKYTSKLVEGIDVIQELSSSPKEPVNSAATSSAGMPKASKTSVGKQTVPQGLLSYVGMDQLVNKPGLDPPALGHHDWISGLTLCPASANNWYIVSGSRDGVIKVWY